MRSKLQQDGSIQTVMRNVRLKRVWLCECKETFSCFPPWQAPPGAKQEPGDGQPPAIPARREGGRRRPGTTTPAAALRTQAPLSETTGPEPRKRRGAYHRAVSVTPARCSAQWLAASMRGPSNLTSNACAPASWSRQPNPRPSRCPAACRKLPDSTLCDRDPSLPIEGSKPPNGLSAPCAAHPCRDIENTRIRIDDPVRAHRSGTRGTGIPVDPSRCPETRERGRALAFHRETLHSDHPGFAAGTQGESGPWQRGWPSRTRKRASRRR